MPKYLLQTMGNMVWQERAVLCGEEMRRGVGCGGLGWEEGVLAVVH